MIHMITKCQIEFLKFADLLNQCVKVQTQMPSATGNTPREVLEIRQGPKLTSYLIL